MYFSSIKLSHNLYYVSNCVFKLIHRIFIIFSIRCKFCGYVVNKFGISLHSFVWATLRTCRFNLIFSTHLKQKGTKMKIFTIALCLGLAACVNNGNNLETLCLNKDPNQMTDREVEMCKALMQRPVLYQD